jgi:hypothetical protein
MAGKGMCPKGKVKEMAEKKHAEMMKKKKPKVKKSKGKGGY